VSASVPARIPHEDPAEIARNVSAGIRLLASAIAFVFVAFVFAFFYLKAVNSNGLWRPAHTSPSQGYGIAVLACVLATTGFFEISRRGLRQPAGKTWLWSLWAALALSIAALVVEVLQILNASFSAYNGGGYASVFYGWLAMFLVVWLGAVYWVETLLATGVRRLPNPEIPGADPVELLWPSADACVVYLYLMTGVAVVAYILLYLVK
jgi:hypothetical protein